MVGTEALFNAPIPGQSLTGDPDSRGPWEMPPKFPTANQAIDHLYKVVTSKDFIKNYDTLLNEDKGSYTDELVAGMLEEGFLHGLWSVDVLLLLIEPLTIMMVWCAANLNKSPSFATDTGYEDRTGFEELTGMVSDDLNLEGTEESAVQMDPAGLPQESQPIVKELEQGPNAQPQSPLVSQGV